MVGKGAIGVEELAARGIGPQGFEHLAGVEAARAIARIDNNLEPVQRLIKVVGMIHRLADLLD